MKKYKRITTIPNIEKQAERLNMTKKDLLDYVRKTCAKGRPSLFTDENLVVKEVIQCQRKIYVFHGEAEQ